jgi:hypothetical protein
MNTIIELDDENIEKIFKEERRRNCENVRI